MAVVVTDAEALGIAPPIVPPESRLLGLSLVWRAVLFADRLGADEILVLGERRLVAGIASARHISARLVSGGSAELDEAVARRPGDILLLSSPWLLVSRRHLEGLLAHAQSRLVMAAARASDPTRPWPDIALGSGFLITRMGRQLEPSDGQALPLFAGPAGKVAEALGGEDEIWHAAARSREVHAAILPPDAFVTVLSSGDLASASRFLLDGLSSSTDGLVDRHLNRRLSKYLTLAVIETEATPNHITAASFVIGLAAVALIATGRYRMVVAGAVLLQLSSIVDCADGEVARLNHMESRFGAAFDIVADNIVHVALFLAIGYAVSLTVGTLALWLGIAAAMGGLISFLLVFTAMGSRAAPGRDKSRVERFIDRMTNRDFSVLLLGCAIAGKLSWFLWALAIGVQVFWIALLVLRIQAYFDERQHRRESGAAA